MWSAFEASPADGPNSLRNFFLGQFLALLTALATLGAHLLFGPLFSHSVYLFCLPALLACAALGGFPSAMSATVILAAGAFAADSYAQLPQPERFGRVVLFLLLGAAVAYGGRTPAAVGRWNRRLRATGWKSARRSCGPASTPCPTPAR